MSDEYKKWYRRVSGQVRDCMTAHPEYFSNMTDRKKSNCIHSLSKRIVGEIVAVQTFTSGDNQGRVIISPAIVRLGLWARIKSLV